MASGDLSRRAFFFLVVVVISVIIATPLFSRTDDKTSSVDRIVQLEAENRVLSRRADELTNQLTAARQQQRSSSQRTTSVAPVLALPRDGSDCVRWRYVALQGSGRIANSRGIFRFLSYMGYYDLPQCTKLHAFILLQDDDAASEEIIAFKEMLRAGHNTELVFWAHWRDYAVENPGRVAEQEVVQRSHDTFADLHPNVMRGYKNPSQYYKRWLVNEIRRNHSAAHNVVYEVVLRARLDMVPPAAEVGVTDVFRRRHPRGEVLYRADVFTAGHPSSVDIDASFIQFRPAFGFMMYVKEHPELAERLQQRMPDHNLKEVLEKHTSWWLMPEIQCTMWFHYHNVTVKAYGPFHALHKQRMRLENVGDARLPAHNLKFEAYVPSDVETLAAKAAAAVLHNLETSNGTAYSICDVAAVVLDFRSEIIKTGLTWLRQDTASYLEHTPVNRSTDRFDASWSPYWSRIVYWDTGHPAHPWTPYLYATLQPLVFPHVFGLKCDPCDGSPCNGDPNALVPHLVVSQYDRDVFDHSAPGAVVRFITVGPEARMPKVQDGFRRMFPVHHHQHYSSWTAGGGRGAVEGSSWLDYVMLVFSADVSQDCVRAAQDLSESAALRVNVVSVYCGFGVPSGFTTPMDTNATRSLSQELRGLHNASVALRNVGVKSFLLPVL